MTRCGITQDIIRSNLNDVIDRRTRDNRITLDNYSAPVKLFNYANNYNTFGYLERQTFISQ